MKKGLRPNAQRARGVCRPDTTQLEEDEPDSNRTVQPSAQSGQGLTDRCIRAPNRGRTWWAHFENTRINIAPTILQKEVEEFLNIAVFAVLVEEFEPRRSPVGLPRSLGVAVELAELPESLMTKFEPTEMERLLVPDLPELNERENSTEL